jgi:hypothetical protein
MIPWKKMYQSIEEVTNSYRPEDPSCHRRIYETFRRNLDVVPVLKDSFQRCDGFGELPFAWNWFLLVKDMPDKFKFLEIGVYKGRVLSQVGWCADFLKKNCQIYGITPLSTSGDKYSGYPQDDYLSAINRAFLMMGVPADNLEIIKGLSQDPDVLAKATAAGPFDIVFIDGCHDYEVVCQDIENYVPLIRPGGYLVLDDASLYIKHPHGLFLGHPDVGRAIKDKVDPSTSLKHLYAVGHNRVWKKI